MDDWRKYEVDLTPLPVIRQRLVMMRDEEGYEPETILDPCAGYGAFGEVCREVWPGVMVFGHELRSTAVTYLDANGHYTGGVVCGDFVASVHAGRFDLCVGNPPYTLCEQFVRAGIQRAARVELLMPSAFGDSKAGAELFLDHEPGTQYRVPGRVRFRSGLNPDTGKPWTADMRGVSWWGWDIDRIIDRIIPHGWHAQNMPILPAADRRWDVVPGLTQEQSDEVMGNA